MLDRTLLYTSKIPHYRLYNHTANAYATLSDSFVGQSRICEDLIELFPFWMIESSQTTSNCSCKSIPPFISKSSSRDHLSIVNMQEVLA